MEVIFPFSLVYVNLIFNFVSVRVFKFCSFIVSQMQKKRRPMVNYIERVQRDVTIQMRGILVDWLVEVAEEYRLLPDTLHLSVSYLDWFLSINPVTKSKLQLLGVASMLIAS